MFRPVDSEVNFVQLEERILELWKQESSFAKRVELNRGKPRWSFLDGPITANNPMGVHHAWGRMYKDLFLRFHAMTGHELRYQNGFDCQGLWVEVEVEKELGFKNKKDIETYGIDRFVEKCKERVEKYAAVQTAQSIRLGYWTDWDNSYFTMSEENNYCVWLFLKRCHEKGWIYKGTDAMPWCPRCGTGISEMEIATEGYKDLTHTSLTVRFPFVDDASSGLLVWTTTPWTLAANVAAAVHPDKEYARLDLGDGRSGWALAALAEKVAPKAAVLESAAGSALVGRRYRTAWDDLEAQRGVEHRVIPWDEVTETEGTGIVHIAPGCGAEDYRLGKELGLAMLIPISESGDYLEGYGELTGKAAGTVAKEIASRFKQAQALIRSEPYKHRYPVCWRCSSELLFRVVDEWYIKMDEVRPAIQEVTRKIRWMPEYGLQHELDWLANMRDWMISKKRYWGLALPIFECECGWFDVIGSEAELQQRATAGLEAFAGHTPHRPYVDGLRIPCPKCGAAAARILDVGNPWLDAGIVPYSTMGYRSDRAAWERWFPADFITESLPGQFRNWFYAMLCMSTVMENREPFKAVLGHALVRDEKGEEMHKSKGNSIPFDVAASELGVDAMRWLYARQSPTTNLNFGPTPVSECRRRLLTLWNVYSFFVTYARLDGWDPAAERPAIAARADLDRWILSRLATLTTTARERIGDFDPAAFVRAAEGFLEELSNWYLRRSRRRFWKAEADDDKRAAYATLYECLETASRLLAPVVPFVTEEIWQNLVRGQLPGAPDSVHHADYPVADAAARDLVLEDQMAAVLAVIELGRAVREEARLKVRQPLATLVVVPPSETAVAALARFDHVIKEELNVKSIDVRSGRADFIEYQAAADFKVLGARAGAGMKALAEAIKLLDPEQAFHALSGGGTLVVEAAGQSFTLATGDLKFQQKPKPGFAARVDRGYTVAFDINVTPELRREGLARDVVRAIQDLRKAAGLEVEDRILIRMDAPGELSQAVAEWHDFLVRETLATELTVPWQPLSAGGEVKLGNEVIRIAIGKV